MPVDLRSFNPANAGELAQAIAQTASSAGTKWWGENEPLMRGYINSLSEAAIQTSTALAAGRIKPAQADQIMRMQEMAFRSTIQFTRFMTLALAQKVYNAAFELVGWAIFNRTGINLFPTVVKP